MQNRDRLSLRLLAVLTVGSVAWACSSSPSHTNGGGTGGEEETGGSSGDTGGKGGSGTGGKGTGGSMNTGGSSDTGGAAGGSTGGSGGSTGGAGGSTGGAGGSTGGAGGSVDGGAGGMAGGTFALMLLGLDETMKFAGGPVFTPAQSRPNQQSPEMKWTGVPAEAKSLAIVMIDTQTAPSKTPPLKAGAGTKVHFTIYNIPTTATGLPAKLPNMATLPEPMGALASQTFEGRFGWFGPGGGPSVYRVELWAIDVDKLPGVNAGASQAASYTAIKAHGIGKPTIFLAAGTNGGF
jgi:Raf kinase inhibitor-like YbhB/YbcL family protein